MPYTFDGNPKLFRIALTGHVTMWDLHGVLAELNAAEEPLAVIPPRIIDLSGTTSGPTSWTDVLTIVEERRQRLYRNSFKVALIAPRDIDVGNARMFQILGANPQIHSEIFPTTELAERWLAEP